MKYELNVCRYCLIVVLKQFNRHATLTINTNYKRLLVGFIIFITIPYWWQSPVGHIF